MIPKESAASFCAGDADCDCHLYLYEKAVWASTCTAGTDTENLAAGRCGQPRDWFL